MRTRDTREAGEEFAGGAAGEVAGGRSMAARFGNGKGENEKVGGMEPSLASTHAMKVKAKIKIHLITKNLRKVIFL